MSGTRSTTVLVSFVAFLAAAGATYLLLHQYGPKITPNVPSSSAPAVTVPAPSVSVPAAPSPAAPAAAAPTVAASLFRRANFAAVLERLGSVVPSNGGVVYADLTAARASVEYIDPDHGTLVEIGPAAGGGARPTIGVLKSTILGIKGTFTVFDVSAIRPAAPARIVAALRHVHVKAAAIQRLRLSPTPANQHWTIYLTGGKRYTADRDGRALSAA